METTGTETLSPMQPPSHYYPYEPGQYVLKNATHILGPSMFVIRRISSTAEDEAYQARYINQSTKEMYIDIFYPQEFLFID